jgi:hypothetical protein
VGFTSTSERSRGVAAKRSAGKRDRGSEQGPRCPHCSRINPAIVLEAGATIARVHHCQQPFNFWIEKLPFYCTDDGAARAATAPCAPAR